MTRSWVAQRSGAAPATRTVDLSVPVSGDNSYALLFGNLTERGSFGGETRRIVGHSRVGDGGGGSFVWDALSTRAIDGGMVNGPNDGGAGRWIRALDGKPVTPQMFGAQGKAIRYSNAAVGPDDTAAVQLFFSYVATNECEAAELSGSFVLSGPIEVTWDVANGTKHVRCNAKFFASTKWATEDSMLKLNDARLVYFSGSLSFYGNTGVSAGSTWSTRKTGSALYLNGCGRAKFDFLYFQGFKYWGERVLATANGSAVDLGHIRALYCGQSKVGGPTSQEKEGAQLATFTVASIAGTANSNTQRTVLSVSALPPDDHYDDNDDDYDNCLISIAGKPYLVVDKDNNAGTITVFGWVVTSGTTLAQVGNTGELAYITGGAVDIQGGDSNVVRFSLIDATGCGIALWSRALYGCIGQRVLTQQCAVAIAIGRNFDSANLTTVVDGIYFEGNVFDVIQVTSDNVGSYLRGEYAISADKCHAIWSPMTPAGKREHSKFIGVNVQSRALGDMTWDRRIDEGVTQFPTIALSGNQNIMTLYGDSKSLDDVGPVYRGIKLSAGNVNANELWTLRAVYMVAHGSGSRGQPTGQYRFVCDEGYTVNGGSRVEFSGFTHPPLFVARLDGTAWSVSCVQLESPLAVQVTVDPPSLAAGAVSAISTVAVAGASLGDYVPERSFSADTQGAEINAWVSAAGIVSYQFRNPTANTIDLASGTLRLRVRKGS